MKSYLPILFILFWLTGCGVEPISIGDREATTQAEQISVSTELLTYCDDNSNRCIVEGEADAELVVFEFSDYACPHCKTFVDEQYPLIRENLIETGEIRYVVLPAPILGNPPLTRNASNAALCALAQGNTDYHAAVFDVHVPSEDIDSADLLRVGEKLGLEMTAFTTCVESRQYESDVLQNRVAAQNVGVTGTPTLLFNGDRVQATYQALSQAIAAARR